MICYTFFRIQNFPLVTTMGSFGTILLNKTDGYRIIHQHKCKQQIYEGYDTKNQCKSQFNFRLIIEVTNEEKLPKKKMNGLEEELKL